jgi:sigma-E factor negative regulatory protein RseB
VIREYLCSRPGLSNRLPLNFGRVGAGLLPLRGVLCALLALPILPAYAESDAREWLEKMATAVESLNYQGTLVYMRPGQAETFQVFHRVAGDEVVERVVAMDGDGAEIIRTLEEIICIFPAQRKVVVDKRKGVTGDKNPLTANLPEYTPSMSANYKLALVAGGRVVGRSAVAVSISPNDRFRYGYRIWLDEQTAMPLKTQLIGDDETMPVEELFFTTISMPATVAPELVMSAVDTDGYSWVRHGGGDEPQQVSELQIDWSAAELPAGFMQTDSALEYMAHADQPRVHLVYSDGLASVSVFVDDGAAAAEQEEGLTTMGATNAYSVMINGSLVTAMGQVPAQTVHLIATSMQPQTATP